MAAGPTRRAVIAAAGALPLAALSGCASVDVLASPPSPSPDVGLLQQAIAGEELMIARYAAVLRDPRGPAIRAANGSPGTLTGVLAPLLAEHRAHLAQLRSRLIVPAGGASPSPSHRAARPPAPPGAPAAAVAFLRAAEQAAAGAMLGRLRGASPSLAQLFASISASEATHVPVLAGAARDAARRAAG